MTHVLEFVVRHGYAVLFVWILAEQAALPLPSIPLLLACGALARGGRLSLPLAVVYALAACLLADNAWFAIGRRRGTKVLHFLCRIALEPDSCVRKTESAFLRYGSRSLLVAKFIPGLNTVAAPLAAISGMSQARFVLMDSAGALIWIGTYTSLGYAFSMQLDRIGIYLEQMGSWAGGLGLAVLAAWIGGKYWQRRRFLKQLALLRISADELRSKLDAGEDVVVVDVRSLLESEYDAVPGALRIPLEDLEKSHDGIPRDRDIVLFCS